MKILYLATRFPNPPVKGDQNRVFNSLKYLARKNEIYFVCTSETIPTAKNFKGVKGFTKFTKVISLDRREQYLNLLKAMFTLTPFEVMYFRSQAMQNVIDKLINTHRFDVIVCQMVRSAPYLLKYKDIPKVLDFQDAYSMNMKKRYLSEHGPVKWVAWLEWKLLQRYEQKMLQEFDLTTIVSERDRQALGGGDKIRVIPIGIEPEKLQASREPNTLIFSGNLKYFPNRDAITWFVMEVFPKVKERIQGVQLWVVGATPPLDVAALGNEEDISVYANVPSIKHYLARATLAVAPMRSGSGSQFKIIEALSVKTPVVTTIYAKQGLEFIDESVLITAPESPNEFAETVVKTLSDQKLLEKISNSGYDQVVRYYSWKNIMKNLDKVLKEAIKIHENRH